MKDAELRAGAYRGFAASRGGAGPCLRRESPRKTKIFSTNFSQYKDKLRDTQDELRKKNFDLNSLKDQLSAVRTARSVDFDPDPLLKLITRRVPPSPAECLDIIELVPWRQVCTVLDSARSSASKARFIHGSDLLNRLIRLCTTYRDSLLDGGDNKGAPSVREERIRSQGNLRRS